MRPFRYERPTDTDSAVAFLQEHAGARPLAGGTNLIDLMKLGVATPDVVVDVSRLPLDSVDRSGDGGVRIGTNVRNADLAAHPLIRADYPVLSRALLSAASPQLRNLATTGGNLLQRTRCVYFQDVTTPCNKREPGTGCSAIGGYTRYHAVFGHSSDCIATHPSDMAVALAVLDATVIVVGPGGERRIPVTRFHRLPGDQPQRDTVLESDELVVAVELPPPVRGAVATYRKVRDRASFAFAIVSVAAHLSVDDGVVTDARIACGGVAHAPWRATRAEETLTGRAATAASFAEAADAELAAAEPVDGTEFKVPLLRRTMIAVLRDLTAGSTSGRAGAAGQEDAR
ncbi:xanthine dehydrogenase YagS FAD-binding subunit [Dietzia kunjamensis]|jgi:xanthine dehydrogenase YagS FAD-binding subunit|uniref:FAD binding domain-containing protein n=1 Tax=Dietzia TaxID=37914 RepID=UPI000848BABF|nr:MULTISPECIES: xanthine dehydrogenase family protein subunit M [Dietzia]MVZ90978.1 xanthine dehydrogenase family protein subunit M [Microbacter sp. ANSKLAB05]ODQ84818.1 molybdopterin dehydrogenase [Dietzia alimentaria]MBB0997833.1 xanthine dehydrogenase family protein subunit M [Dietzia maris]MBB1011145.1 xanthine dehydrogenase family protein subunit M [Dietzia kunjamensis]MCZ4655679.1 xanthine dehydrogenase family protein subunit M [Dietzia kunjamensis]